MPALFAFLHHVAAFTLFAALAVELVLVRSALTVESARKIRAADAIYGISAGVLLVVGLARVFHLEKGTAFYLQSWTFLAKLALFILLGLMSIVPTMEFVRWRPAVKGGQVPTVSAHKIRQVRSIIHLELVGVVLILLFAALMARGIGVLF
jgi:putative membrane protein